MLNTASNHRRRIAGKALYYSALVVGAFVAVLPLLFMVATSLKTYGETVTRVSANPFSPLFWPQVFQFGNYVAAWTRGGGLSRYFLNSVVISTITVLGVFVTSATAAFAFAKLRFPGKNLIFALFLVTLMIPETVLTIPNYLTVASLGWINSLQALTVPFMAGAFFIFLLRQFFQQVPDSLLESAEIDGSTKLNSLLHLVLPLSTGPLFTVGFLAFTGAWNALQWPLVVTQTARWRPISVGLLTFITDAGPETQLRMAGATITLAPVVLVYIIAQRQITESITRTGVKG